MPVSPDRPYHHGSLKAALLVQAMDDIEVLGLEGLSLRGLAERAGVSKTAPYRHFADRRDLLVSLAAEGFGLLADALELVPLPADAEPTAALRALFRAYVDFARARPALYKLMISRLGYELHSEECRRNSERALACLVRAVGDAQAEGMAQRAGGRRPRSLPLGERSWLGQPPHRRPPAPGSGRAGQGLARAGPLAPGLRGCRNALSTRDGPTGAAACPAPRPESRLAPCEESPDSTRWKSCSALRALRASKGTCWSRARAPESRAFWSWPPSSACRCRAGPGTARSPGPEQPRPRPRARR